VVVAAADTASHAGIDTTRLFDGMPFDDQSVRKMWTVSWDDYATIVERFEELAGGPEACSQLLKNGYHTALPEIRQLAGALISPKTLGVFLMQVVDPIAFEPLVCDAQDLGPERMLFRFNLRPGARPCLTFFRGTIGALEGIPFHLGAPAAVVDADVGPTHGRYDVTFPPSSTLIANGGRVARDVMVRVLPQLGRLDQTAARRHKPIDELDSRLASATHTWALTPRQTVVLRLLVKGEANKDIAGELQCAENTVELHVTEILRKAGAPTRTKLIARFWSEL
jgi:DNA-binding CsgD family transcriptional regulator